MARIAFAQCGFPGFVNDPVTNAPVQYDKRCHFPFILASAPHSDSSYSDSFANAFAFFWNYRTIAWSYNITLNTGGGGTPLLGGGTCFVGATASPPVSEQNLVCEPNADFLFNGDANIPSDSSGILLADYDPVADTFTFNPTLRLGTVITSEHTVDIAPVGPWAAAGITCTMLGKTVQLYYDSGSLPSGASGNFTATVQDYWPYDNGKSVLPTDGPIFDSATGAQLITPVPIDI